MKPRRKQVHTDVNERGADWHHPGKAGVGGIGEDREPSSGMVVMPEDSASRSFQNKCRVFFFSISWEALKVAVLIWSEVLRKQF